MLLCPCERSGMQENIDRNAGLFEETVAVQTRVLEWDHAHASVKQRADVIIAGDVVYAEHAHEALLCVMRQHLNPTDGIVLCVNSRRNGSMDRFVMTAKASFSQVDVHHHFDADVSRMLGKMKCDPVLTVLRANATGGAATPADSTLERLERLSEERAAKQATELSAEKKAIREAKGRQKLTDEYVQKYKQRKEAQLAHDRFQLMAVERPASATVRERTASRDSTAQRVRPCSADATRYKVALPRTGDAAVHHDVPRRENQPRRAAATVPHVQLCFDSVPKSAPAIVWAQRTPALDPMERFCSVTPSPAPSAKHYYTPSNSSALLHSHHDASVQYENRRLATAHNGDRSSLAEMLHAPGFSHRLRSLGVFGSVRMPPSLAPV